MTVQKSMKWILGMALGGMLAAQVPGTALASDAGMKIGYVDMQKAIQETTEGKKAKKELEKEFNAKKGVLQKKESDIKKMAEDFEKKQVALSDELRAKKQQELNQEMMKFQKEVGDSQLEIQKKERDLTGKIIEKLQVALEKVAKEGGYTIVLEKNEQSVLYAKKDYDLTDAVVKEFERTTK